MKTKPLDLAQFEGFTPGPWHIGEVKPARFPAYPINGTQGVLAEVSIAASGRSRHDARLIAAAPALLAECHRLRAVNAELVAALTELLACPLPGRMQTPTERTKTNTNHQAVCHRARAALAKVQS